MNKLMKTFVLAAFAGAVSLSHAQMDTSMETMKVMEEITRPYLMKAMEEAMKEGKEFDSQKLMDDLGKLFAENADKIQKAQITDCVSAHGEAKKEACTCLAEKSDAGENFKMMMGMEDLSEDKITEKIDEYAKKLEKDLISCGFTEEEIATGKAATQ